MQKHHSFRLKPLAVATSAALLVGFGASAVHAADNLPDMGSSGGQDWRVDTFYENDTRHRKDTGLSKFRNTLQVEADKDFGGNGTFSSIKLRTKFRGTYDGVYKLNDDEYGKKAGGPIRLQNGTKDYNPSLGLPPGAVPFLVGGGTVPHGGGPINYTNGTGLLTGLYIAGGVPAGPAAALAATNNFADTYPNNPNSGMIVLGEKLHKQANGVAFGVPQRPCDEDKRGCIKDYMDANTHELESPEFNDRLDFIREAFVVAKLPMAEGRSWNFQLGKQQVVWGRTDLFRVLDVINPVDYSRNNIYDELQDIRIPMWIFTAEYRMGATETFDDTNIQFVWNFDKFRPNNLGQGGTPNQILGAGDFFRGMKNLWDNGGTVANFAFADPSGGIATNFGANQIGIRKAHMPEWSLANTQVGIKWEGVYKGTGFSLNALTFRSQLPSLRNLYSKGVPNVNPFTSGGPFLLAPGQTAPIYPYNIAFDIYFPRVNLVGGSMDMQLEEIKSSLRLETAVTKGEEFANTAKPGLYSESKVWRYVIGLDRPTFIPFLNEGRAFLLSGQLFGQHLLDHEEHRGPWGKYGMPDHKHNHIATFLMKGWYQNDRVSPQIIMAHDFEAGSSVAAPSVEWLYSDNLKITFGANYKFGDGAQKWNDARDGNPFPPYSGGQAGRNTMTQGMAGLTGYEPLGRFRAGPIGMANKEDEVSITVRYKF
jgi:hypothetical protein